MPSPNPLGQTLTACRVIVTVSKAHSCEAPHYGITWRLITIACMAIPSTRCIGSGGLKSGIGIPPRPRMRLLASFNTRGFVTRDPPSMVSSVAGGTSAGSIIIMTVANGGLMAFSKEHLRLASILEKQPLAAD